MARSVSGNIFARAVPTARAQTAARPPFKLRHLPRLSVQRILAWVASWAASKAPGTGALSERIPSSLGLFRTALELSQHTLEPLWVSFPSSVISGGHGSRPGPIIFLDSFLWKHQHTCITSASCIFRLAVYCIPLRFSVSFCLSRASRLASSIGRMPLRPETSLIDDGPDY